MNENLVLFGAGNIAINQHIPTLIKLGVKIKALVDPSALSIENARKTIPYNDYNVYKNIEEVDYSDINLALIASPSAYHHEHVMKLAGKGINIFCEKPLAISFNQANEIFEYVKKNNIVFQVGFHRRFQAFSRLIKELIITKKYGNLQSISMKGGWIAKRDLPQSILDKTQSGGGITMDYGVHFIDRVLSWSSKVELEEYSDDSREGIEVNSVIQLKAEINNHQIPVRIYLSWTNVLGNFTTVTFDNAILINNFNAPYIYEIVRINNQNMIPGRYFSKETIKMDTEGFTPPDLQWKEFIDRVKGGPEIISSLKDAVRATEIVEKCYKNKKLLNLNWGL
jgi:predicted dehydrogenase